MSFVKHSVIYPIGKDKLSWLALCRYEASDYNDSLWSAYDIPCETCSTNAVFKRKAEHFAGRYTASFALSKLGWQNWEIKSGANREPLWPPSVVGSISHTDKVATVVVTSQNNIEGVGVDVEPLMSEQTAFTIKRHILSDSEWQFCQRQGMDYLHIFTLIYSAKEAIFKAYHSLVKQYFDFDAVELISLDPVKETFLFKVNSPLLLAHDVPDYITGVFGVYENHVISLVYRTKQPDDFLLDFNIPMLSGL